MVKFGDLAVLVYLGFRRIVGGQISGNLHQGGLPFSLISWRHLLVKGLRVLLVWVEPIPVSKRKNFGSTWFFFGFWWVWNRNLGLPFFLPEITGQQGL